MPKCSCCSDNVACQCPEYRPIRHTQYRGYTITDGTLGYTYCHDDYNGPPDKRCGSGQSLRNCVNAIDDWIADDIFCEACDSTGINPDSEYGDTCPHCHDARECQGFNTEYPETCPECSGPMTENWPGSGKEHMRCFKCEPLRLKN